MVFWDAIFFSPSNWRDASREHHQIGEMQSEGKNERKNEGKNEKVKWGVKCEG